VRVYSSINLFLPAQPLHMWCGKQIITLHAASVTSTYLGFHFKLFCVAPELSRLRDELRGNRPCGLKSFAHVLMANSNRLHILVYLCVAQGDEVG